ncbi:MAG: RluA family pseudouridine synthase [Oscillospiraceae bacterium]
MSENSTRKIEFLVTAEDDGKTVGEFLRKSGTSRRLITKLKRCSGGITLNGTPARTVDIVHEGDIAAVSMQSGEPLDVNADLCAPIVYEDDDVVVYDKPVDMPVHPSHRHRFDTLGNLFAAQHGDMTFRPINRLDKDTSGLCAVAKNSFSAARLSGSIEKTYFAVVCGKLSGSGQIDAPIGRCEGSVITREVRSDGQRAVTNYTVIGGNEKYTLVRIKLETGRTHQIRVHFAYIGHPLAGDDMYGGDISETVFQALHCGELEFSLPVSGERICLSSPIREDMMKLLRE